MIHLYYGVEEYCVWYAKHKLLDSVSEFNKSDYDEFEESAYNICQTTPLFDDMRIVCVYVNDLKDIDTKTFNNYLLNPSSQTELIILPNKVDKRGKLYKTLEKHEAVEVKEFLKLKNTAELKSMIGYWIKGSNVTFTDKAADLLIERLNYFERDDVNLWTLKNAVMNLIYSTEDIVTEKMVIDLIPDNEKENVFALIGYLKKKDISSIKRQEDIIIRETGESIGALSALLREFRIAYKKLIFNASASELGVRYINFTSDDESYLKKGIEIITEAIKKIKSSALAQDTAISYVCEQLMM